MLVINRLERKGHGYKVGNIKMIRVGSDLVEVHKRGDGRGKGEVLKYRLVK